MTSSAAASVVGSHFRFSEVTKSEEHTVYQVEVMWPDTSDKPGDAIRKWSTYYRWSFNDCRNPRKGRDVRGSFEEENGDVSDVPERLGGKWRDSVAFSTPEAANAYAARLRECGMPQCGWAGQEEWRAKYRQLVDARVVEERYACIRRVVSEITST